MPPIPQISRLLRRGLEAPLFSKTYGLMGAGIGGATAKPEEGESRLMHALGGAALGGVALPLGLQSLGMLGGARKPLGQMPLPDLDVFPKGKAFKDRLSDYTFFSMLSSPDTIIRANAGAIGGAVQGAMERVAQFGMTGELDRLKEATRIMTTLVDEGPSIYRKILKMSPQDFNDFYVKTMGKAPSVVSEQHMGGQGIGRLFAAPDIAAVNALKKGGFSSGEAARYTLSGEPASALGKTVLDKIRKAQAGRGGVGTLGAIAATQLAPFPRVAIQSLEKGAQRFPLAGLLTPRSWRSPLLSDAQVRTQKVGEQLLGTGVMGTGYLAGGAVDPRITETLGPLAGPGFLPFQAGREWKEMRERGEPSPLTSPLSMGKLASAVLKEGSPFGHTPGSIALNMTREIPRRMIPAIVGDVAKFLDPAYGREQQQEILRGYTRTGEFDRGKERLGGIMSNIPTWGPFRGTGMTRQELPENFPPVDILGRQQYPRGQVMGTGTGLPSELLRGLSRTVFPSHRALEPTAQPESVEAFRQLREYGIEPSRPRERVTIPGTGIPVRHTPTSASVVQRLRGAELEQAIPRILAFLKSPEFLKKSESEKMYWASQIRSMLPQDPRTQWGRAALPAAMATGAQVPTMFRS
jgi:hypothetical protein